MAELRIGCLVMAAGSGSRFGRNKLEAVVDGKSLLRRSLEAVPADSPFAQRAESLAAALRRFQPLPPERVPQRSLLREFLGGGVV